MDNVETRDCIIKGQRIGLSRRLPEDAEFAYELWHDPVVQRAYNSRLPWATLEDFVGELDDPSRAARRFDLTIISMADGQRIGVIGLQLGDAEADLAIILCPDCRKQGFGTEAVRILVEYAFTAMGLDSLTAGAYEHNVGSIRMLEKTGFVRDPDEDTLDDDVQGHGKVRQLAYRIFRKSWMEMS